ncbi:DUF6193 family natural product biosynthesis protein [Streptomyces sp. NPDC093586]|uniref:DUF6193 family natural product biosynthesis protein n=1 Tax=Streptomyces sp. NPDC093586 TaxID=3366042 RepID=UPI003829519F
MDTTSPGHAPDLVEAGWQKVRADGRIRPELLEAAYAEPRPRQLFPWTGMGELHFSRCTKWPWTGDIPYLQPAPEGAYRVSGPLRSESVGPAATPRQAVTMVADRLPLDCGPAFVGAREELAVHDAATLSADSEAGDPDRCTSWSRRVVTGTDGARRRPFSFAAAARRGP